MGIDWEATIARWGGQNVEVDEFRIAFVTPKGTEITLINHEPDYNNIVTVYVGDDEHSTFEDSDEETFGEKIENLLTL